MATVATAVITGKRQNNHTMISADNVKIAKNAAIFVRVCDDSVMPTSPRSDAETSEYLIQRMLLNGYTVKPLNPPKIGWMYNQSR